MPAMLPITASLYACVRHKHSAGTIPSLRATFSLRTAFSLWAFSIQPPCCVQPLGFLYSVSMLHHSTVVYILSRLYIYARVILTLQVPLHRLWVSAHSWASYSISFRPCTLMVMVVTESAPRPRAYSSPRALSPTFSKEECA